MATNKERALAVLEQETANVNQLIKNGGYTQEVWKQAVEKLKVANSSYSKACRLEKYAELAQADSPVVMFLMDYSCEDKTSKPVEDKDTKKIEYKIETGVQELYLDEFDDYVHKAANAGWTAQLKIFAREMGVYKLKRFTRGTTAAEVSKLVRDHFEINAEIVADNKTKLMGLLQELANMVLPGLEMSDSELAMMENVCTARFNSKNGKEDIKLLPLEKQCDLLKYAMSHALLDSKYTFDLKGAKKSLRTAGENNENE